MMTHDQRIDFLSDQLMEVCPLPVGDPENGQMRLKLQSDKGASEWITITPVQYKLIEDVLWAEDE